MADLTTLLSKFLTALYGGQEASPATGAIGWETRSVMKSPSDGVITLLNNAENDFGRVQLGGTTSSFPSLKRSTNEVHVRLADDSAYAVMRCSSLAADECYGQAAAGTSRMSSPTDGNWLMRNNAGNAFGLLQLGGTTSSFPAIKRSTTQVQARLADDSAFANFACAGVSASGTVTSADGSATPAGGSAGIAVKVGTAGVGFYIGTGAPSVSAPKGSIYVNTTATTTTTRMYINTDGATTWTNFTTAA